MKSCIVTYIDMYDTAIKYIARGTGYNYISIYLIEAQLFTHTKSVGSRFVM